MKCEELLKAINAYVDGEIDPAICNELQAHLEDCSPCRVVVDTLRQTITLYREGQPYELPAPCHQRLHQALQERWQTHHENDQT